MKTLLLLTVILSLLSSLHAQCTNSYSVVSGDTCFAIAQNNGITVDQLTALNSGIDCDNLSVGQSVCIQGSSGDSNSAPPNNPTDSNNLGISEQDFDNALTNNGFPSPSTDQYNAFINNYASAGGITSKLELAMFLAEVIQESGGLQFISEQRCQADGCPNDYRSPGDDPNLFYYGRGYLQLTWSYNYKAASEALYGDDRLVTDPDQVANDQNVAWQTAFWFWNANVHGNADVQNGQFGSATNIINGALECNPCNDSCNQRFQYYITILEAWNMSDTPNNAGC